LLLIVAGNLIWTKWWTLSQQGGSDTAFNNVAMGLNCSRPVLDDQCTYYKPRHMYSLQHVDLVKLKKLIKAKRLSPCYPPMQDSGNEVSR